MNARQHMFNSILLMLVLFIIRPTWFFIAVPIGTMLPDMDIHLQRSGIGKHRKTLHNIWIPLILLSFGYATGNQEFFLLFGIGVLIHLIGDSLSKTRTYPFYPLKFSVSGFVSFTKPNRANDPFEALSNDVKTFKASMAFVLVNVVEVALLFIFAPYVKATLNFLLGLA